jgi:hypothetical protein
MTWLLYVIAYRATLDVRRTRVAPDPGQLSAGGVEVTLGTLGQRTARRATL